MKQLRINIRVVEILYSCKWLVNGRCWLEARWYPNMQTEIEVRSENLGGAVLIIHCRTNHSIISTDVKSTLLATLKHIRILTDDRRFCKLWENFIYQSVNLLTIY